MSKAERTEPTEVFDREYTKDKLIRICDEIHELVMEADRLFPVTSVAGAMEWETEIHLSHKDFVRLFPETKEHQAKPLTPEYRITRNGRFYALWPIEEQT